MGNRVKDGFILGASLGLLTYVVYFILKVFT